MNNIEFVNKAIDIAKNYKTLYVMGCFGAPMTDKNKNRYCNNNTYNKQAQRTKMIQNASADTFGFDCVCLIKGILWGWNGNKKHTYGGAEYCSNGVPDINETSMINQCKDVSTNFANMEKGEALWTDGHIGIYIGDGLAVECTPSWTNNVQITAVGNIGKKSGYNTRTWKKRGKLPYITYIKEPTPEPTPETNETIYIVQKGDTLSGIAKKYNTTYQKLAEYNGIKDSNKISVSQKIKIPTNATPETTPTPITYTVKKGDTLSSIAKRYNTTVDKLVKDNNIKDKNKIYVGQKLIIK